MSWLILKGSFTDKKIDDWLTVNLLKKMCNNESLSIVFCVSG